MLPEGAQLMLLTDGVVEARARSGELFGFERTADLASQPAESIAEAAEQDEQEDDITVLMLTQVGGTPSSTATHHAPVGSSPRRPPDLLKSRTFFECVSVDRI